MKLVEAGFSVDVFVKDWDITPDVANTGELRVQQNVRFFEFTTRPTKRQVITRRVQRFISWLAIRFGIELSAKAEDIIDPAILARSNDIVRQTEYLCFIGVEQGGLIWAGLLSERNGCPLMYFSLELCVEGSPDFYQVCRVAQATKKYHRLSIATIIQDARRAEVLLKSSGIADAQVIYYPVSVGGGLVEEKSTYLQDKFHMGGDKHILLYFGLIAPKRYVADLVRAASRLDEDVILVVHGWGPKAFLDRLQAMADRSKVVFSLDVVPEAEIVNMVASADIGVATYSTGTANERLTALSSSKLAYYTQCGLPVIAFDTESLRELMSTHRFGELIVQADAIPLAVRRILADYDVYRREAHAAFREFYDLDRNFPLFLSQFEDKIKEATHGHPVAAE